MTIVTLRLSKRNKLQLRDQTVVASVLQIKLKKRKRRTRKENQSEKLRN